MNLKCIMLKAYMIQFVRHSGKAKPIPKVNRTVNGLLGTRD